MAPGWRAEREEDGLIRLIREGETRARVDNLDAPDPVTLELFNRRFMGVAEAMGAALERTAHSVNIKERLDFSCALFDADGGLVANAPHMPVHLGSMGASVRAVKARHPRLRPGDAFALNNPYDGGTHLPDITVVMPVFPEGAAAPAFYLAARGHHADIGGIQPGSMPPFSRTIEEEGVLLDALTIMRDGVLFGAGDPHGPGLRSLSGPRAGPQPGRSEGPARRLPSRRVGGVGHDRDPRRRRRRALHGFRAGERRGLCAARHRAAKDGMRAYPWTAARKSMCASRCDAKAGEAVLDFTGTSAVQPNNFNAPTAIVHAAALYVFRTLVDDDIPLNAGCLKPLKIIVPDGSMLAPSWPAAVVAGNVETSQHIVDALFEALGVMANAQGTMNNFTFGDEDRQYYETLCGGAGATARADGAIGGPHSYDQFAPDRPGRFSSGALRCAWNGSRSAEAPAAPAPMRAARACGGFCSSWRPSGGAAVDPTADRAPGSGRGRAGAPGHQRLISPSGEVKDLPGCFSLTAAEGDAIEILTPGGGGHGPLTRR